MKGTNLNLSFNLERIYENANFQINDDDKVGIVGVNGAGKTTLFKVILKEIELDSGKISISSNKRIGYLPQEVIMKDKEIIVFDYLLSARPIKQLEKELESLYEQAALNNSNQSKILKKIAKVQNSLEYYDYYNAENILLELISNMDIDSSLLDIKLNNLSGGQKSKIAFAHLLYSNPEILLLDEPTNHLDQTTRDYITNYLKGYKGTILIISHDIEFLNAITNKIMFIDKANKNITVYNGNYNDFVQKHERHKEFKERLIKKQEDEIKKLRDIVLLYSNSSGKRKRMAQSREKLLSKKLESKIVSDKGLKGVKLNIKPLREGSKIPLKINNIKFNYDDSKTIINDLSFIVNSKEKFLIVGENGVGKTTLLKLIIGELKPKEGNIWFGDKTDLAYYAQEQELLEQDKTVLENVNSEKYSEKELRTILGSFLFYGDDAFKKVKILSPGERARLSLCKIMLQKANLLLLDEATNHLDPDTQKIIGEHFKNYEGTIIMVSHNMSFVETIGIDRMLILPSGKITNYSKEVLEYYNKMNIIS
ncbi:MAG: ABC-F family ATP-binding cassette domain-containing protein [Bacilli bacterium]|nr:ABC-F family ATP-binding cassette domain-containing protein [Bacilli bacterium]MDD4808664.1 ABC-F family ATP-binding cassette domain-containing protein [Bacilli bacterium]